ncbi:MAG: Unknown protein [uncultured Sulfurovum sp.]|uniref:Uncharacterized protein n=1 Tax=uncultured Sulfurovum sp. TaxID=269237 RepID=A0A6S6TL14_9BACT|nr:MAG: Unknown protein [uncultured Sulfurovum sp.]
MGLNDEIGNFSKRREIESTPNKYDLHEENEYEEWDEEEEERDASSFDFRMYTLDELDKFNQEVKELDVLTKPWWKNLKVIFTKSTFSKIGLVEYKKKYLLSDDTFRDVEITNVEKSLDALDTFNERFRLSDLKRVKLHLFSIVFYAVLGYFLCWNLIFTFLVAWSVFDIVSSYFKHKKHQKWVKGARHFIDSQHENNISVERLKGTTQLEDVMAFNAFIAKEEKEHWSIKFYDAVANLFKRKK